MASAKNFLSLLAGLTAGAALGILYAPDKGWKTRARVRRTAANEYDHLKDNLSDVSAKVGVKTAEAKESLKNLGNTIREKTGEIKGETRDLLLQQLDRLENALQQAEDAAEEMFAEKTDEPEDQQPEA